MRWLHLDPVGGVAGDMAVAALLDAGGSVATAHSIAAKLGCRLSIARVLRAGMPALHVNVQVEREDAPRTGPALLARLGSLGLAPQAAERGRAALVALLEAEADVHEMPPETVHLHEAGGQDALFDIAASAALCTELGVDGVSVGPLPYGGGTVRSAHGVLPVPAPATLRLLSGYTWRTAPDGEWVTPTGAAVLRGIDAVSGLPHGFRLQSAGAGAGSRNPSEVPNALRALLGEADTAFSGEWHEAAELVCDIDDMTGEEIAHATEALRAAGALDVSQYPLIMKKGRPGVQLAVLAHADQAPTLAAAVLRETTSLGVRVRTVRRLVLRREITVVETPYGPIRIKTGPYGHHKAEYDDLKQAAERCGVPLWRVRLAALTRGVREGETQDR